MPKYDIVLKNLYKSKIAKERIKILNFYKKHKEKATKGLFQVDSKLISKRIKDNNGNLHVLISISIKSDKFRTSTIDFKTIAEIKNTID